MAKQCESRREADQQSWGEAARPACQTIIDTLHPGDGFDLLPESASLGVRQLAFESDHPVPGLNLDLVRMSNRMPHPAVDTLDQDLVCHGLSFLSEGGYRFGGQAAHTMEKILRALRDPAFVPSDEAV